MDYFLESLKEYKIIREEENKLPNLLLHVCCGACSCYPLVYLVGLFNVTILFSNSNIYPLEEFNKRLHTLIAYKKIVENQFGVEIPVVIDEYDYDNFEKDLLPFKDRKEGNERCKICISKRMERLFIKAQELNFKYVTTVMSISRNKNTEFLNSVGKQIENRYQNITFLYNDFKKNNGQDIGVALSKKYNVYRQEYCGCRFSNKENE